MRVNVENMLRQSGLAIPAARDHGGYRYMLGQLAKHLKVLRDQTAVGNLSSLDEFFKLYVFDDQQEYTRSAQETSVPHCCHEWRLISGKMTTAGYHYVDRCTKCGEQRERHTPLGAGDEKFFEQF